MALTIIPTAGFFLFKEKLFDQKGHGSEYQYVCYNILNVHDA